MTARRGLGLVLFPVLEWLDDRLCRHHFFWVCRWCNDVHAWSMGW